MPYRALSQPPLPPPDAFSRVLGRALAGPLPAILVLFSLLAGAAALLVTPREEEPQIVVPVADVLVQAPELSRARPWCPCASSSARTARTRC